ncbi:FeS assembly protein [Blattabacterium sp. (Blattella germanica) str. Bge]|uniref:Fe-S cluster assembly protein SufD n=1 Tax=Blattabacterium sp. (Blattella germanica) TaxID=624186 RepID=UPI0001BB62BD|nr:Fe-S cluster assembly protein SufD [Blattabacterium sp. (Blattella germanica)]ACY40061.1 FeS assembly protein [Blattabacterium sp. (Blattella germanica) str. Bge]
MQLKEKIISLIDKYYSKKEENSYISFLQQKHINLFKKKGFPSFSENEEWKNTDINPIINQDYHILCEKEKIKHIEYKKIKEFLFLKESFLFIFIDGKYNSFLSQLFGVKNHVILSNIASQKENEIKNYYGKLSYQYDVFYTLNTLFSKDGVYIYIPDNIVLERPIEILHISTGLESGRIMLNSRNLIVVGERSDVKIIEHHKSLKKHLAFINSVSEIYASNYSRIDYYKVQDNSDETFIIDNTFLKQKKHSQCSVWTFSFQGNFIRNNLKFYSRGEKTSSYLYGISLLSEKQLVDHHTLIDHFYSNAYSYQLYKNILFDQSKGIFNGKIIVNECIKGINAFQRNSNILLSDEACMYTKPQLEIYSEDVKCSHGCTIGNLQEEELFYLQSRGISERNGKILLLFSFLEEILNFIHIFELKKLIYQKMKKKLNQHL